MGFEVTGFFNFILYIEYSRASVPTGPAICLVLRHSVPFDMHAQFLRYCVFSDGRRPLYCYQSEEKKGIPFPKGLLNRRFNLLPGILTFK